jgi:Holliday junction resolvasome RuvABC DNA-binding subunit
VPVWPVGVPRLLDLEDPANATRGDLVSALLHLGYSRPEADRAADRALRDDAGARFEDALRRALRSLASR